MLTRLHKKQMKVETVLQLRFELIRFKNKIMQLRRSERAIDKAMSGVNLEKPKDTRYWIYRV